MINSTLRRADIGAQLLQCNCQPNFILFLQVPTLRYISHPVFTLKSSNKINRWKEMNSWKQMRKDITARWPLGTYERGRGQYPASTTHANRVGWRELTQGGILQHGEIALTHWPLVGCL